MGKYTVEVMGEHTETVWGDYEVEADSEDHARERAITQFYDDGYGADVVETYVEEVE